jgi:hypothetical protein
MKRLITALLMVISAFTAILASQPAHAAVTHHPRECWGANAAVYGPFAAAVPQSCGERVYYDTPDKWPASWPAPAVPGARQMISIRPSYAALMSGADNALVRNFCATAPAHSRITMWQENPGGNPLGYPPSIHSAGHFLAMQKRMMTLVSGTPCRFGVIIIAPFGSVLSWIYRGDDWFGYDFYAFARYLHASSAASPFEQAQGASFTTAGGTIDTAAVTARMDSNLAVLRKFTGRRYPLIAIGETNAAVDSQRPAWFGAIGHWFTVHYQDRGWILTRWISGGAGLCGPWPPSVTVVADLHHLAWAGSQ